MPEGFAFPVNHQYWILPARIRRRLRVAPVRSCLCSTAGAGARRWRRRSVELSAIGERTAAAFPETNATLKPQVLGYTKPINDIQDVSLDGR